ncbi:MAG: hypothetical protein JXB88_16215 [Spirochaetales bacterium]|nr:hypothetical protein [Spirochaetales bacterium]
MKKQLTNIEMGKIWTSYIGSAYGVMKAAGLWTEDILLLMGKTGMAFHFIVHEQACPSSVTVYDWSMTHFDMMDRIGVYTDSVCIFNRSGMNTFDHVREDAIMKIKASIDKGTGVVIWAPSEILEFGIITGYDDSDRIFFIKDCISENPDPLLYDNLGRAKVPYLYIQYFHSRVPVDNEKVIRDSLGAGVYYWQEKSLSAKYACGADGYKNLIHTLEQGNYDEFGLTYIIQVYADAKFHLTHYLDHAKMNAKQLKGLDEPAQHLHTVSDCFQKMTELVPFTGPQKACIDKKVIPRVIELTKKAEESETKAMEQIKRILE